MHLNRRRARRNPNPNPDPDPDTPFRGRVSEISACDSGVFVCMAGERIMVVGLLENTSGYNTLTHTHSHTHIQSLSLSLTHSLTHMHTHTQDVGIYRIYRIGMGFQIITWNVKTECHEDFERS